MKVLVTGTDGYIGTLLGSYLLDRGQDVTGVDTGFHRVGWLYNGVRKMPYSLTKDIRNITEQDLKGFDAVVHLAELSNDPDFKGLTLRHLMEMKSGLRIHAHQRQSLARPPIERREVLLHNEHEEVADGHASCSNSARTMVVQRQRRRATRLDAESRSREVGIYRPKHQWQFSGNIKFAPPT